MHRNGTLGLFANGQELSDNMITRIAAVHVDQVVVVDALRGERLHVVVALVQPDNIGNVVLLEEGNVLANEFTLREIGLRIAKGNELARNDPIQIAILHLFVVAIVFEREGGGSEDFVFDCLRKTENRFIKKNPRKLPRPTLCSALKQSSR